MTKIRKENAVNLVTLKQKLAQPTGKVLPEELKVLLYSAKTNEDLELVVNSIKRCRSQEFRFATPLMRVLYVLDKPDKALELFMAKISSVAILLMNKLYESKRYDDVIRVYKKLESFHGLTKEDREESGELLLDALVEKNTSISYHVAGEFFKHNREMPNRLYCKMFLLAMSQNDAAGALGIVKDLINTNFVKLLNMTIVALNALDRTDEVRSEATRLAKENGVFFYRETVDALKQSLDKANDQKVKEKLQKVIAFSATHLNSDDLRTAILKNYRLVKTKPERPSTTAVTTETRPMIHEKINKRGLPPPMPMQRIGHHKQEARDEEEDDLRAFMCQFRELKGLQRR